MASAPSPRIAYDFTLLQITSIFFLAPSITHLIVLVFPPHSLFTAAHRGGQFGEMLSLSPPKTRLIQADPPRLPGQFLRPSISQTEPLIFLDPTPLSPDPLRPPNEKFPVFSSQNPVLADLRTQNFVFSFFPPHVIFFSVFFC